jgi:hypothetical protein
MSGSGIISEEQVLADFFCSEDEYAAADFVFKTGPDFYARQQMSDDLANRTIIIANVPQKIKRVHHQGRSRTILNRCAENLRTKQPRSMEWFRPFIFLYVFPVSS